MACRLLSINREGVHSPPFFLSKRDVVGVLKSILWLALALVLSRCTGGNSSYRRLGSSASTTSPAGGGGNQSDKTSGKADAVGGSADPIGGVDPCTYGFNTIAHDFVVPTLDAYLHGVDTEKLFDYSGCPEVNPSLCSLLGSQTATVAADRAQFSRQFFAQVAARLRLYGSRPPDIQCVSTALTVDGIGDVLGRTEFNEENPVATAKIRFSLPRLNSSQLLESNGGPKTVEGAVYLLHEMMHVMWYPTTTQFIRDLQSNLGPFRESHGGANLLTETAVGIALYGQALGLDSGKGGMTKPAILGVSDGPLYDFGRMEVSGKALTKTFTVTHTGDLDATQVKVTLSAGPYSVPSGSCAQVDTLGKANRMCTVTVSFPPGTEGVFDSALNIAYHSGPDDRLTTVSLKARVENESLLEFGGMYGQTTGGSYGNPLAGGGYGCGVRARDNRPYIAHTIMQYTNLDWPLVFCYLPHEYGTDEEYDFGGVIGYYGAAGSPYGNPPANGASDCPAGYAWSPAGVGPPGSGQFPGDWNAYFCYRAHQKGRRGFHFGGMFGNGSNQYYNPATMVASCLGGYNYGHFLGTPSMDWDAYLCWR